MTIYLFDNSKNLIGDVDPASVMNHAQKSILNGTITATVTAVYSADIESAHYFGSHDVDDSSVFWMYRITSVKKYDGLIDLQGIHLLFDELQAGVIRDIRPQGVDASDALGRILDGTNWQIGIDESSGVASKNYYHVSRLSAFWDFLTTWRVEFRPRLTFLNGEIVGRHIDIYDQMSDDFGKWYEYGDNLITVTAEQANEGICTAVIGMGKGEPSGDGFGRKIKFTDEVWTTAGGDPVDKPADQDYVSLPSAVAIYGLREAVVDFPEIEDPAELLQASYDQLITLSRPRVEFFADTIEQGLVHLGETITIVRDDIGIRYKTRVFEIDRNFADKTIKSIRFGDKLITTSAERIQQTQKAIEIQNQITESLHEINRLKIIETYTNGDAYEYRLEAGNEYGLPAGTYSFDRPIDENPTSVIYIGGGLFLIANEQNPDGSWNWRTFGSGDGLGADMVTANNIVAGSIDADHINADGLDARVVKLTPDKNVQDAISEVANSVSDNYAELQIVDGMLQTTVSDVNGLKPTLAQVVQDLDGWGVRIQGVEAVSGDNADAVANVVKFMRFDENFLTIGKSGSPLEVQVTNDAVNFYDGGAKVAWISGQQLFINSAVVTQDLTIGNHRFEKHNIDEITVARWTH